MSDKYKAIIVRYELARANVRELKNKRSKLLSECGNINNVEYPQGSGWFTSTGKTCLTTAYDELLSMLEDNHGEGYSYDEVLNEMECAGDICESCYESYQIKTGPLADAKKEFGNAKRAIHYAGRKLIKEDI